jgi:hypothetical protein
VVQFSAVFVGACAAASGAYSRPERKVNGPLYSSIALLVASRPPSTVLTSVTIGRCSGQPREKTTAILERGIDPFKGAAIIKETAVFDFASLEYMLFKKEDDIADFLVDAHEYRHSYVASVSLVSF